jgi:hypothetical protein
MVFIDMKIILTEGQYGQLMEMIKLDIKVGDTIMGGKFKNKKIVVKTIGKNDKGDITINGKPLLRFRILKENINKSTSQSKILWLRRRLYDPEINDLLTDIVIEGFDYSDPCNYGTYDSYELNIANDSSITFINSYIELYGEESFDSTELEKFVREIVISKHRDRIQREWRDRDCDEEEEDWFLYGN